MDKFISARARAIEPSPIRRFTNLVKYVPGAISLTIGQPDFPTPECIKDAGMRAIENNMTSYTDNRGYIELRRAIASFLRKRCSLEYSPDDEITVTVGAEEGIDAAVRTLVNPGDRVLIPSPGYVAYRACTLLSGGEPVFVPAYAEDAFRLRPDILQRYITANTKLLILSYPSNPTGAVMDEHGLSQIAGMARDNDMAVISDEIYSELTYGGDHTSIASLPGMKERTVVINGFSKAYSMTGFRLGYLAAPAGIMAHLVKVHQFGVTCAPSISQAAGIEALKSGGESCRKMNAEYDRRRVYCYRRLLSMGMDCVEPKGALYLFPSIKKWGLSSESFCSRLLFEGKLAVVPGSAFGPFGEGYIRISYAYSGDVLKEGLDRLEHFIDIL